MKKNFKLDGIDCANCAAKMERGIQKIEGVNSASINFLTSKLVLDFDETKRAEILAAVQAVVRKVDPDVVVKKM